MISNEPSLFHSYELLVIKDKLSLHNWSVMANLVLVKFSPSTKFYCQYLVLPIIIWSPVEPVFMVLGPSPPSKVWF